MPDISADKMTATAYPPQALYERWASEAEDQNTTISQYIIRMVEAGRTDVDLEDLANDSLQELRQQRADLQEELKHHRTRVKQLEEQLHHTAQVDILEYIEDNPGATTPEIIQHIADTVPTRVASHLDILEENALKKSDNGYHLDATDVNAALDRTTSQSAPSSGGDAQ